MRWLRVILIAIPLLFLALVSFMFGTVLGFSHQLSPLQSQLGVVYTKGTPSVVLSADGHQIGTLTSHNSVFLPAQDIPAIMSHAIVAIEDKRFYTEPGIDVRGIARAIVNDVFHPSAGLQGASTITEQFIKLALHQESNRTLIEKLKEAGLAVQLSLSPHWRKTQILADYLNIAYYGSGAYGVEAAAKAYFGNDPGSPLYGCGQQPNTNDPASLCVTGLTADEAALLAAAVESPHRFDFLQDATYALARRNLVLKDMYEQGYLTAYEYRITKDTTLPPPDQVRSPSQAASDPSAGYFVSWVADQLVNHLKFGPGGKNGNVYTGGYVVHTTLDYGLQRRAQQAVNHVLPEFQGLPSAALVAIDNSTGEVRAMVGGYNYNSYPFNLATEAQRQPGSAWKVFDLATALESGSYGADTTVKSAPYTYTPPPGSPPYGVFVVHNDEHSYYNAKIPLWEALAVSDNSVFARVGLDSRIGGTYRIAQVAREFGITTTVSRNPSMVIGGLAMGVTPLDMAHAYQTLANRGKLSSGTLVSDTCVGATAGEAPRQYAWEETAPSGSCPGPIGINAIIPPKGQSATSLNYDHRYTIPVPGYSLHDYQTEKKMLEGVLTIGTAQAAQVPGVSHAWGKTGTTSNYTDAWFIGSIPRVGKTPSMTVAVWVGYVKNNKSMKKTFGGKPVYGGTLPAIIWHDFIQSALGYYALTPAQRQASIAGHSTTQSSRTSATSSNTNTTAASTSATQQAAGNGNTGTTGSSASPVTTAAGGTTTPTTGSTSATGSGAPATVTPPGTSDTTATPPSTPATPPPSTTSAGGVTAPSGGAAAPPG